jgi:hypothetical protein
MFRSYVNDKYQYYAALVLEHYLLQAPVTVMPFPALAFWVTKQMKAAGFFATSYL